MPTLTEHEIRYHLPQERGWSYVHVLQIERGADTRWLRPEHNPEHRWWSRLIKWFRRS